MKTTSLIALSAILGTCAFAQDTPAKRERPQRPPGQQRQMPPELVKKYDKDGDGKLSETEITAMREAMRALMEERRKADLEKFDADKDGKLDEAEIKTMRETKQKEMLEKYDTNKDGKIDDAERAKIPASERMSRGFGGRQGGRQGGRPGGRPGGPPPADKPAE